MKKEIDWQAVSARLAGFQQLQRAVEKRHVTSWRDDVGAVRPHDHPVFDLEYLHARVAPDQLGQDALVVGGQMLHQHKRHVGVFVGRHPGKERLERGQPARRRPDANHRKIWQLADCQTFAVGRGFNR